MKTLYSTIADSLSLRRSTDSKLFFQQVPILALKTISGWKCCFMKGHNAQNYVSNSSVPTVKAGTEDVSTLWQLIFKIKQAFTYLGEIRENLKIRFSTKNTYSVSPSSQNEDKLEKPVY